MTAPALSRGPLERHGAFAWSFAVAISVAALSARFDLEPLFFAACAFLAAAAVVWAAKKLGRRLAAAAPADATPGTATLRACAYLGIVALWLWTAALLVPAFVMVYPQPGMIRAYAESLGIDLAPMFHAAFAYCVAVTLVSVPAVRALRDPAPGTSTTLRAFCLGAPLVGLLLAMAPFSYFPAWGSAWASRGEDLPASILFFRTANDYWGIVPALALAMSALAWARRSHMAVFTRSVVVQLFLLMLCSALLTLAVWAVLLPQFSLCSDV